MENRDGKYSGYFSKKLRAGKRRTYFFDVRSTKQGDFFLTITESKKKYDTDGYESHKIFLYKEDFKKFMEALNETVGYVKTELMPEYDFDAERTSYKRDEQGGSTVDQYVDHKSTTSAPPSNQSGENKGELTEDDMTWS